MQFLIILLFLFIFGAVLLTMRALQHYFAAAQKKKAAEMLQGPAGAQRVETKLLLQNEGGTQTALVALVSRLNIVKKIENDLSQSGLKMSLEALLVQMLIATLPGALLGLRLRLVNLVLSMVACGLLTGTLPYLRVRQARKKRMREFEQQFPEALDFLARAMRAGHAFSISLEMLAEETAPPLGQEFKKVFNEHNLGLPIETALSNLAARVPLIDVSFFVSAVLLQRETGGNLSEILGKLAHVIRERFKVKGQVQAASAHARVTGSILTLMPVALMLGLMTIAPGYLKGMAEDPDGQKLIAGAIGGIILGHFAIQRIVNIKV
jgi:tight adherence protein B